MTRTASNAVGSMALNDGFLRCGFALGTAQSIYQAAFCSKAPHRCEPLRSRISSRAAQLICERVEHRYLWPIMLESCLHL